MPYARLLAMPKTAQITPNTVVTAKKLMQTPYYCLPLKAKDNIHAIICNFVPFIDAKSENYFYYLKVNVLHNRNLK